MTGQQEQDRKAFLLLQCRVVELKQKVETMEKGIEKLMKELLNP
jgi:hypothetical protein